MLATARASPSTMPAPWLQPNARASAQPATAAIAVRAMAPGTTMRQTRSSSCGMEMHPDAEHEQDDADLGELGRELRVGDEAGGIGTDDDAGEHVAHQRGQADPAGRPAQGERDGERAGEGRDSGDFGHGAVSVEVEGW